MLCYACRIPKKTMCPMKSKLLLVATLTVAAFLSSARATNITGYDVFRTELSGSGGWAHSYTGAITGIGGGLYNYTGGDGTMNDGILGTNESNTHLFETANNS